MPHNLLQQARALPASLSWAKGGQNYSTLCLGQGFSEIDIDPQGSTGPSNGRWLTKGSKWVSERLWSPRTWKCLKLKWGYQSIDKWLQEHRRSLLEFHPRLWHPCGLVWYMPILCVSKRPVYEKDEIVHGPPLVHRLIRTQWVCESVNVRVNFSNLYSKLFAKIDVY